MSYRDFWRGSWREYFAYLRAYAISEERRVREADSFAWWQGQYIAAAMMSIYPLFNGLADPKKSPKYPYPKKPWSAEKARTEEEREKLNEVSSQIQEHNLIIRAMVEKSAKKSQEK